MIFLNLETLENTHHYSINHSPPPALQGSLSSADILKEFFRDCLSILFDLSNAALHVVDVAA